MEYTSDFFEGICRSNNDLAKKMSTVDEGQQAFQPGMSMLLEQFSRPSPGFSPD